MKRSNIAVFLIIIFVMIGVFIFINDNSNLSNAMPIDDIKEPEDEVIEGPMNINITIDGTTYTAVLDDNDSAKEVYRMLPLNITMNELNGKEKTYYINNSFSTDPTYTGTVKAGDIVLFGNDNLRLFYKTFSTSTNYTKIGSINDASKFKQDIKFGDVKVSITKAN